MAWFTFSERRAINITALALCASIECSASKQTNTALTTRQRRLWVVHKCVICFLPKLIHTAHRAQIVSANTWWIVSFFIVLQFKFKLELWLLLFIWEQQLWFTRKSIDFKFPITSATKPHKNFQQTKQTAYTKCNYFHRIPLNPLRSLRIHILFLLECVCHSF